MSGYNIIQLYLSIVCFCGQYNNNKKREREKQNNKEEEIAHETLYFLSIIKLLYVALN